MQALHDWMLDVPDGMLELGASRFRCAEVVVAA
jgi:hypothetical protein